jgi:dipeptidyl aminopeptidase/acylaminoacyl peptidase
MPVEFRVVRLAASAMLAGFMAAVVIAATPAAAPPPAAVPPAAPPPAAKLQELDEVLVTPKNLLPLKDFLKLPRYQSVAISPSGKRLLVAWVDNDSDYRLVIGLNELPSMKAISTTTLGAQYNASEVSFAGENRLLSQIYWPARGLLRRHEPLGMITITDADGGNPHHINREAVSAGDPLVMQRRDEDEVAATARAYDAEQASLSTRDALGPVRLVSRLAGRPDQLLLQTTRANQRSGGTAGTGAFLFNLKDNRQTPVATLPLSGARLVLGPDSRVALATGVNARNETVVYYLPENARAGGKGWQLVSSSAAGERGLRPIAWTGSGEEYYALDGRNLPTRAVVIWNALTNTQRVLYRHANADMDHFALDPSGKPWLFHGRELSPVYWYPDPEHPLARLHRSVVRKAPGEQVAVTSASDDLKTAVVRVSSARRPPLHMVVNVETASSLTAMFSHPELRGRLLTQVDPIEVQARDGLVLHGYLTNPADGNGKLLTKLPMVVMAHDGPQGEPAGYDYEFERQLFASRGYAVLQVNHRGTSGRGAPYERAGDRKWGTSVQNDYVDVIRWAISDGVADPQRICFYGSGYGAFSAMTTAAREPTLLNCVIGVGGVYDLAAMLGDGKKPIPAALQQVLGDDMEELKARSPVSKAAAIKAKVLLMPQDRDQYVPIEQSMLMRNALKDAGIAAQWEIIGQQGDGQHTPETRVGAYTRILKFLEEHIGK